jgi:hypothetical protein
LFFFRNSKYRQSKIRVHDFRPKHQLSWWFLAAADAKLLPLWNKGSRTAKSTRLNSCSEWGGGQKGCWDPGPPQFEGHSLKGSRPLRLASSLKGGS